MPTLRIVQAIVRQRTSVAIDRAEAGRLTRLAWSHPYDEKVEIQGRDRRTGAPRTTRLTIAELLTPPDDFIAPV